MKYKKFHLKRLLNELQNRFKESDSSSDQYNYIDIVEEAVASETSFNIFRSDQRYKDILEHINDDLAEQYYLKLREELSHKEIFKLSQLIKNIGNPTLKTFEKDKINPGVLRYINVAFDLKNKFPNSNFEKIVELGAGFGGQALILDKFYNIKKYTFIDLFQVNQLIKKFIDLHKYNFEAHFFEIETFHDEQGYDLFLSNYAFSELPKKLQINTVDRIIRNSDQGYMIVNNFHDFSLRYLTKRGYSKFLNKLAVYEEIPESYIFNKIITFNN